MTDRFNKPSGGSLDWHVPLNENFSDLDIEVAAEVDNWGDLPAPSGQTSSNGNPKIYRVRNHGVIVVDANTSWEIIGGTGSPEHPIPTGHFEKVVGDEADFENITDIAQTYEDVTHEDYGAVGDGVFDSTTAFKDAVSLAERTVYVPEGEYVINDNLDIGDRRLIGDGPGKTILRMDDDNQNFISVGSNGVLRGMTVDGNNNTQRCVNVVGDDARVENVKAIDANQYGSTTRTVACIASFGNRNQIVGCQAIGATGANSGVARGILVDGSTNGQNVVIRNYVENVEPRADGDGIVIQGGNPDSRVVGNHVEHAAKSALKINSAGDEDPPMSVVGNTLKAASDANSVARLQHTSCTFTGNVVVNDDIADAVVKVSTTPGNTPQPVSVTGNVIELTAATNAADLLRVRDDDNNVLIGNNVLRMEGTGGRHACQIDSAQNVAIISNTIQAPTSRGIYFDGTDKVVADSNIITDAGNNGIRLDNVASASITNNVIRDPGARPVMVSNDSEDVSIIGNTIETSEELPGIMEVLSASAQISGNKIVSYRVTDNVIQIGGGIGPATVTNNVIELTNADVGDDVIRVRDDQQPVVIGGNSIDMNNDGRHGIMVDASVNVSIFGNSVDNAGDGGIRINGANEVSVNANTLNGINGFGIYIAGGESYSVTGNTVRSDDQEALYVDTNARGVAASGNRLYTGTPSNAVQIRGECSFTGNQVNCQDAADAIVKVATGSGQDPGPVSVSNNSLERRSFGGSDVDGIRIRDNEVTVTVSGNTIDITGGRHGIQTDDSDYVAINGNTINNPSGRGVSVDGLSTMVTVSGNVVQNAGDFGIYTGADVNGVAITGNTVSSSNNQIENNATNSTIGHNATL